MTLIKEVRFGKTVVIREFGQSAGDPKEIPRSDSALVSAGQGKREDSCQIDHFFWLGHDLMLSIDATLRNGKKEDIVFGTNHALFHLDQTGLGAPFAERLAKLNRRAEESLPSAWTDAYREDFAKELRQLIGDMGHYLAGATRALPDSPG